MTDTIREQIVSAIVTRLVEITTARGYNQALGASVFRARPNVDPDDCPCVVVWPRPEDVTREFGANVCAMEVEVQAIESFGSTDPSTLAEQMLGDLIECMTARKWSLDYDSGGVAEIEAGDTLAGATSGATAIVDAVTLDSGTWAGGDAAGTLMLRRKSGTFQDDENLNKSGGQANIATVDGAASKETPETGATGGLANDIQYARGGTAEYPSGEDSVVGTSAVFVVTYKTMPGNPYAQ